MKYIPMAIAAALGGAMAVSAASAAELNGLPWYTVVNNGDVMPDSTKKFNAYNQPSVNNLGDVVFRARSKGGEGGGGEGESLISIADEGGGSEAAGGPTRGIYKRCMWLDGVIAPPGNPILKIADVESEVPQPNNATYGSSLATFNEFPAFPRSDFGSEAIATRGQSQPVYTYTLPDLTDTKVGTSGIYTLLGAAYPSAPGVFVTGASQLGNVPGFSYFQVPGVVPSTKFDQFPGSPAITNNTRIAFKGNYSVPNPVDLSTTIGKTGVYWRNLSNPNNKIKLIANPDTLGLNSAGTGSTAPPSAANNMAFFVASDNENAPTIGGIYKANLSDAPAPQKLVSLNETRVPNTLGNNLDGTSKFNRFGEGVSVSASGQYVAFWGAWGTETRPVTVKCPADGNQDVIKICMDNSPAGDGVYTQYVPVNQGIFVHNRTANKTYMVARTVTFGTAGIQDFNYWTFSGAPPSESEEGDDREEPRWRSSAFVAVTNLSQTSFNTAFKAKKLVVAASAPVDGIYSRKYANLTPQLIKTVLQTGQDATKVDVEAPIGALIVGVGLERDALRTGGGKSWFTLNVSMLNAATTESWAGIYLTTLK